MSLVRGTKRVHAAQKTVKLISEVCRCTRHQENPKVLDPFAGSWTTLLAARRQGIQAVGVE
ncbi:DNA methyltransferase [Bremerella cremea]|uniref:DNA methyltransferase n=1 Tax=Bremerella cremea TaxID=1031537 RepID=UPI001313DC8F